MTADTAAVSFDSVSFAYTPGREILNNLSFTVNPGQKVAIVGSSGSGYEYSPMSFYLMNLPVFLPIVNRDSVVSLCNYECE